MARRHSGPVALSRSVAFPGPVALSRSVVAVAAGLWLCVTPVVAGDSRVVAPADNLRALSAQFNACLVPPPGMPAAQITLRFSLRRDGALIGRPHVAFLRAPPGEAARRAALEGAATALDHCLPARMVPALGEALAGRMLTLRLISGKSAGEI